MMGLGMLSIWNIVACVLLMVAMRTRKELIVLVGLIAYFAGWLVGVVLIIRSSIKIINLQNQSLDSENPHCAGDGG